MAILTHNNKVLVANNRAFAPPKWSLPTHTGTLGGGAVIDEPIPFPA